MVDKYGNKYLIIKLSHSWKDGQYSDWDDIQWSLILDDKFEWNYWFCPEDYEVYSTDDMRKYFFNRGAKLNETKILNKGFIKAIGKTHDQAYDWFLDYLRFKPLKKYITAFPKEKKEKEFWKFAYQAGIYEEMWLLESWMRVTFAKVWCQQNEIAYRLELTPEYPEVLPRDFRKNIITKMKQREFYSEYEFINKIKENIK